MQQDRRHAVAYPAGFPLVGDLTEGLDQRQRDPTMDLAITLTTLRASRARSAGSAPPSRPARRRRSGRRPEPARRDRALLRRGRHLGLTLSELGAPLGITTRRGLQDRIDRLDALLEYDRPDGQLTRTARREHKARDARRVWIDDHRTEIRAVLAGFLAQTRRFLDGGPPATEPATTDDGGGEGPPVDDAGQWLEELTAELRNDPTVLALDPRHHLHTALREIDALRARMAGEV